jgi:hypothetical protein
MTPIYLKAKTIELAAARTAEISTLTWRTHDDAFARKLQIIVNNATAFTIADAGYDALGQWTDDTIQALILARYALEVIA